MTTAQKDPVVVVVQLSGGNDYLNTVIPYNNEIYYDNRPTVGIPQEQVLHLDDEVWPAPADGRDTRHVQPGECRDHPRRWI